MYTATNVSRSVRPKEGECSPEYATSLKLVTGQDALSTQCLFTGTAEQSSKGWHAAHGCLAAVRQRRCPFAKFSGQEEFKKGRRAGISLLIIEVISQKKKFEEEVYTRPLPLTSCQEDRLGLDYTVLCLAAYARLWLADLFSVWPHDLGRNIQRESSRVAPMEIRPPGFLAPWLVAGNVVPSAARGMRQ